MASSDTAEKRGPDVFTVTAGVVGPQAAEQVLVALADAGYVVRADGVPAPDTAAHRVELALSPDQYEFLRRLLWGVGIAYQAVDGGPTDGVLRMGDLPGDFRDLVAVVSAARRTE